MGALVEINTDGLAKLADTISFALGGTARGERKMAEAKAYAAELEAKTNNKIALIKAQGEDALANYVAAKESRKLRNTMAVIEKAQSHFTEGEQVSDEPVDEGWKNRFFNIVEEISDDELREIWGRVLAGEIKKPKSYSLRTLETLRNITKEEAAVIVKAASFSINYEMVYKESSLSLSEKLLLQELGLMLDDGLGIEYTWTVKGKSKVLIILDNNSLFVLDNDNENAIKCNGELVKFEAGADMFGMARILNMTKKIPDFDYQKFFLLYSDLWCEKITRSKFVSINMKDTHPASFLRVNAVVQQFDEFYETFDIKSSDKMYLPPEKRIRF